MFMSALGLLRHAWLAIEWMGQEAAVLPPSFSIRKLKVHTVALGAEVGIIDFF